MIAAFFDIDGTLYRNSLLIENFKKLIKYEIVDHSIWFDRVKKPFESWSIRKGDYEEYLLDVSAAFKESLEGVEESVIEFIANQVVSQHWEMTYVYTRKRIEWHKEQGHQIFFISGSPDFLVSKMAEHYGVRYYSASEYVIEDGHFRGKLNPMWDSENKKRALNTFVKEQDIDLHASFAYGDTSGDLSMLEMVGHPIAINPNRNLVDLILKDDGIRKRVKIVVERKDMIYQIDPESLMEGDSNESK